MKDLVLYWPQITMLALTLVSLGIHLARHGEPRRDRYNAVSYAIASALQLWILYKGGFFS